MYAVQFIRYVDSPLILQDEVTNTSLQKLIIRLQNVN